MKQIFSGRSVLLLALASVAAGASAQQSEEIVVEAPRVYAEIGAPEVSYAGGQPAPGRAYQVVLQGRVNPQGLDLTKPEGVKAFEKRVSDVALDVCTQIQKLYPKSKPDTQTCAKNAEAAAAPQVQKMVAAAQGKVKQP